MHKRSLVINPAYSFLPFEIDGFELLAELALDMHWTWNHESDDLWQELDSSLWLLTHNPWMVLQTVSREQLKHVLADSAFRKKLDRLIQSNRNAAETPAWFQKSHPHPSLSRVAYFSMEFMLSEALPIYSGGLGNVAGDQLKAASDLGVPVVGIGILYQQGYFRQEIDKDGEQKALFPYNDPGQLPITPLRQANGEWLRLELKLPGYSVWLRVWHVQVGRISLYLLDSNDPSNFPAQRSITSELYGGDPELRLKQELVLGIGGWRLLNALGIQPEVCHLNEGHAAFAILERAYSYMQMTGQSFEVALAATRAGNLFTTHTAVPAGFDCFAPSLIEFYMGQYAEEKLGISRRQLLALGRKDSGNSSEAFNMAYLAIRGSGAVNGVSRLHGKVSRHIFEPLFPGWPTEDIPVGYITNGVHMPTWDSKEADGIWMEACGKERWLGINRMPGKGIQNVPDEKLWEMRTNANRALIKFAREHFSRQLLGSGYSLESIEQAKHLFDPNILTLGFARRFATYKRPNLLLHDPQRLLMLLTNPKFPAQLIISGKAHPADQGGQDLIKEWMQFIKQQGVHPPVIFLGDYDMEISGQLVQGVDVWINTPRRPWEASGTSGMKVLVNGGINLSELDGWWAEAYTPDVGWALGDGNEHGEDPAWDALEAEQLYGLLEQQVIPEFYQRNDRGIPVAWISRMRKSMSELTPRFSADRTVREYTEQHYLPAAETFLGRAANNGADAKLIDNWRRTLEKNWHGCHFGTVRIETHDGQHIFEIQVCINELDPGTVEVELYADGVNGNTATKLIMNILEAPEAANGFYNYGAATSATRPATDYTARLIPKFNNVSVPLETNLILWEH